MSHYSVNSGHCLVSLFKPSGKWKYDIQINMAPFYDESSIQEALVKALNQAPHWCDLWKHYIAVCLEPYHKNSYPVMIIPKEEQD